METKQDESKSAAEFFSEVKTLHQHQLKSYSSVENIFLLEDSTLEKLPKYAEVFLKNVIKDGPPNETKLLISLIYCLALESGFKFDEIQDNASHQAHFFYGSTFNKNFTEKNSLKIPRALVEDSLTNTTCFHLILADYSNNKCLFTAIKTGEFLVITLTNNNQPGRSWCLSTPRYVLSQRNFKNISTLFRNLKELSLLMKEHIFGPIRNYILAENNNLYPGITGLPVELSHYMLKFLKLKDIQNLSKTCWKFRCICVDFYESEYKPQITPYGSKHAM